VSFLEVFHAGDSIFEHVCRLWRLRGSGRRLPSGVPALAEGEDCAVV